MEPSHQKLFARWALIAFAAVCATWLLRLDYATKVSTNVIDLIPEEERAPEIGLLRGFANNAQARVMLFALRDEGGGKPPQGAAGAFAEALLNSGEFAEAHILGDSSANDALGRAIFEQRMAWLLPSWLGEREREFAASGQPLEKFSSWLAERAAGDLEAFLTRPEATALQEILPRDPLLIVPGLVERARLVSAPGGGAGVHALVWARIKASPFAEAGQGPVFAAVEKALERASKARGEIELRWTGVNRFAAASRQRIEAEVGLLNTLSLVGVLVVSCVFVARIHRLLHLVPVILLSLAGAWTASTLVFDRLHILVFVIGSLLAGVAIDYGFYIYMQPYLSAAETYGGKLRRIVKPLLASCLTTVLGFSLLLFSELPLIRQIGFFVSAGLLCALGVAMLYFAQLERPLLEGRKFGGVESGVGVRWAVRGFFAAMFAVAVLGPLRLHWRDDIRDLDLPAPELKANDAELRALFGEAKG
ncbi:MAG TPA: MMPL family transporter, partial [Opitutaceae bacterium]